MAAEGTLGRRLEGKAVIVTGGASGIGRATVARLVAEGGQVLAVDVTAEPLLDSIATANDVATALGSGGEAVAHVANVSSEAAVAEAVGEAVARFGRLDGLVNLAGILRTANSDECSLELWNQILAINLTGTFLMCRAALPHLIESRGSIVNASSTSATFGHPWMAAYAASKGGIAALTQTLAVEYAKRGVRVNAVAPGGVTSGITNTITFPEDADLSLVNRLLSLTGAGDPESVASVIALLVSADGAHMTGSTVRIDGGTHA